MSTQTQELKERVTAKQKRVEARIHELKADGSDQARNKASELRAQLDDIKQRVSDGYENLKQDTAEKLNNWLKD